MLYTWNFVRFVPLIAHQGCHGRRGKSGDFTGQTHPELLTKESTGFRSLLTSLSKIVLK